MGRTRQRGGTDSAGTRPLTGRFVAPEPCAGGRESDGQHPPGWPNLQIDVEMREQHPPRVGRDKQHKVDAVSAPVREIAWKAQCRLHRRYRALVRNGKLKTVAVTAVARELAGFIWAIGREVASARAGGKSQ